MSIILKDPSIRDVTTLYFNHPVWKMKYGETVPDMPLDVQLELINRCNLSCGACPIHKNSRQQSVLEWEVLKRIVDEAAEEGVCYFTICGIGEASLHPDLFKLLGYIRSKKVELKGMRQLTMMPSVLISNAMWPKLQVEECLENPPDLLSLSLAGLSDAEIIERRAPINLDRFYENCREIYSKRSVRRESDGGVSPIIHISTHIYPHEMETRKDDIERFKEKWFAVCDAIVIKPTMLDEHHLEFDQFLDSKAPVDDVRNLSYTNISKQHFERTAPCFETSRRLSINSDGDVWCGHHNSEDFGPLLGNIRDNTLRGIWHSEKMNAFRQEVRAGIFLRPGCKACGGELRDWHRDAPKVKESQINFGGWGCGNSTCSSEE